MDISSIGSGQGVYAAYYAQRQGESLAATGATAATSATGAQTDTARISDEARRLAQDAAASNAAQGTSGGDLPLEAYSIPSWMAGLLTDYARVDQELGVSYADSNAARYDALSGEEKRNLAEYQQTVQEYFRDGLRDMGITDAAGYYDEIVRDGANSEKLHQAVLERLENDPRAMEMMRYFNVV